MSSIAQSIEAIRRVHSKLGTAELARRAGLPYTTVNDCQRRQFVGPSVETLLKLAEVAEQADASADPEADSHEAA
jgi:hypothetical protein